MALDLSTKNSQLEAVDAAIGLLKLVKQAGQLPQEEVFRQSFPKFSLNDILFIISNLGNVASQEELQEKVDQTLEKLELYYKTLAVQPEGFERITIIPDEVRAHPKFFGQSSQDVLNQLEAVRLKIKAAGNEELVKDFSLPEKTPTPLTFYLSPINPPEPQPVYEKPAEILVKNGLVSEEGVVSPDYSEKLANSEFKQKVEAEIKIGIQTEHLEELLKQSLSYQLERKDWANNLTDEEKRFIVSSIAEDYAELAASTLLPVEPENLSQIQQEIKKKIQEKFSQEKPDVFEFLDGVFSVNPNFQNSEIRKKACDDGLEAVYYALSTFEIEILETKLDLIIPKLVVSYFKLIDGKPVRQDLDYYIVPKSPAVLEASYQAAKSEVETLLKVLFEKNKVRPVAAPIENP